VNALGVSRFDLKYSAGTLGHDTMLRSIELYGREVIPQVRAELGAKSEKLKTNDTSAQLLASSSS
jgi:hypothetical protein